MSRPVIMLGRRGVGNRVGAAVLAVLLALVLAPPMDADTAVTKYGCG